jgi:nucleoid-associated protein YgaU
VTRESKLAMMIAVTLILLVGVLLSDHLSGARTAEFDEPASRLPTAPVAGLPGASEPIAALPPAPRRDPIQTQAATELPLDDFQPIEIPQGARNIAQRGVGMIEESFSRISAPGAAPSLLIPSTDQPSEPTLRLEDFFTRVEPTTVTLPPHGNTPVKRMPEPTVEPARPQSAPAAQPTRQSWRTHTVTEGDSLYRLAARYLGDGNRWRELQKLNDDILKGSETVQLGQVLKIAPAPQPTSQPTSQTRNQAQPTTQTRQQPASRPEAKPEPKHRTYVVLKGDSLGKISQSLLGTSRRMNEIVELNGLKDPDDIRVGQTLRIPAR